jgi:lipopolysaccharide export system permease protein
MRLLDRYLLRELFVPLAYCFSGFLIFWVAFDLYDKLQYLQSLRLSLKDFATYYLLLLPGMLFVALPVGLLLALLYALTNHARYNELIAIRAAGISLWRLSAPYFVVGILCSVALFLVNDVWLPDSSDRAEKLLYERRIEHLGTPEQAWAADVNFRNARDERIWSIGGYHSAAGVMTNVVLDWKLPGGARRHIMAARGVWTNDQWLFQGVGQFTYLAPDDVPPLHKVVELMIPELTETPGDIDRAIRAEGLDRRKVGKKPVMSLQQVRQYLALNPDLSAENAAFFHTQFHGRLAEPWKCLVVVFIAIPFAEVSGRRNVFVGVASSIFICFFFVVVSQFSLTLGTAGRLPPWLAAWLPNLLFATGGLGLLFKAR